MDEQSEIACFVLGELDGLDLARFERRLSQEAALRAEVERMQALIGELEGLGEQAWEHAAPAAAVRSRERTGVPAPGRQARPRARRAAKTSRGRPALPRPAVALGAGALALAVALVLALGSGSSRATHTVVLRALADAPVRSRAVARLAGAESLQLTVEHLPPIDPAHYYELWLMTDTAHLRPVAAFHVDGSGDAHLQVHLPVPASAYRYLNISLQLQGGGRAISARSLLRGATAGA